MGEKGVLALVHLEQAITSPPSSKGLAVRNFVGLFKVRQGMDGLVATKKRINC